MKRRTVLGKVRPDGGASGVAVGKKGSKIKGLRKKSSEREGETATRPGSQTRTRDHQLKTPLTFKKKP